MGVAYMIDRSKVTEDILQAIFDFITDHRSPVAIVEFLNVVQDGLTVEKAVPVFISDLQEIYLTGKLELFKLLEKICGTEERFSVHEIRIYSVSDFGEITKFMALEDFDKIILIGYCPEGYEDLFEEIYYDGDDSIQYDWAAVV